MDISLIISICALLFGSGIIVSVARYILNRQKKNDAETKAVALGVQALLRDRLKSEYNDAVKRGYASISDKENFENMWQQYHNLGKNGVMDEIHEEYLSLPTK